MKYPASQATLESVYLVNVTLKLDRKLLKDEIQ